MELLLESRAQEPWTILEVEGELDLYTSPQLRDRLMALSDEGADRIALDLSRVPFMDSSSLGVLVMGLKRLREKGGELALVGPTGSPLKVLALTGLDRVFQIVGSAAELPTG